MSIKTRNLNNVQWELISRAIKKIGATGINILGGDGMSNEKIKDEARKLKDKGKLDAIFIDSFAFVDFGTPNIYERAVEGGLFFKGLAKDLDVPVVAICHNSTTGSREKSASKYNVEGGEGLTRPCWVSLELRPSDEDPEALYFEAQPHGTASFYVNAFITKNRDGPAGQFLKLKWDAGACRYGRRY
jgi:replicative DNA helicase